jgi:sec-independent protein translocase protein TatB
MLSISHLILIFIVALIVFGPEKLPELARTLSKAMLEFRRATGGLRETLEQEMRQLEREINEKRPPASPALPPQSHSAQASRSYEPETPSEAADVAAGHVNPPAGEPAAPQSTTEAAAPAEEAPASASPDPDPSSSDKLTPEKPANGQPTAA